MISYGLHIATTGILNSLYRQEVLTNNLANVNTVGFKPDMPETMLRDPARVEDGLWSWPSDAMLERLGGGVFAAPNRVSFEQGQLEPTGNDLDLAIRGEGFLVAKQGAEFRLTRDGRLARDSDGVLILAAAGLPVVDDKGSPITLPGRSPIQVDGDGTIRQDGAIVGKLQLTDVPDRAALAKRGDGLFEVPADQWKARRSATGRVRQRAVEHAALDEIKTMVDLTNAARAVSANVGVAQYHDRIMERAITLGRLV